MASRVTMPLMRHSDRRLPDQIYTRGNLLGTWGGPLPVTMSAGPEVVRALEARAIVTFWHRLAQGDRM